MIWFLHYENSYLGPAAQNKQFDMLGLQVRKLSQKQHLVAPDKNW